MDFAIILLLISGVTLIAAAVQGKPVLQVIQGFIGGGK